MKVKKKVFTLGPFATNCYILICEQTRQGVIIDPADDHQTLISYLKKSKAEIRCILLTHAHIDHMRVLPEIKEFTSAKIHLHKADMPIYQAAKSQASVFGLQVQPLPDVDVFLEDDAVIRFGLKHLTVIHTPGHSPGGVSFLLEEGGKKSLFSGDTLFAGSIGRTDLWGGSYNTLLKTVKEKILSLPDNTILLPGHGEQTTVGKEKKSNPFFAGKV